MAHILLAEDDQVFAGLFRAYLESCGHRVTVASDGAAAVRATVETGPDLLVLDLMLPLLDGLEVCRSLRPRWAGPILMLTAAEGVRSEIEGLRTGADDYVSKLASPDLILARLEALLRRHRPRSPSSVLDVGGIHLDPSMREARIDGVVLDLSDAEFELLHLLAAHAGTPVTRDTLFEELRGIPYDGLDRAMDVRVVGLRKKLAERNRDLIRAVRGVGYQLILP